MGKVRIDRSSRPFFTAFPGGSSAPLQTMQFGRHVCPLKSEFGIPRRFFWLFLLVCSLLFEKGERVKKEANAHPIANQSDQPRE